MFIKAVSKYFMNFLETDFKRRRVPKRSIAFTDKAGNLTAFKLDKYPAFLRKVSSLINNDKADYSIVVSRGSYTSTLSSNLSEVVTKSALRNLSINKDSISTEIETFIIELFTKHEKDQEIFFQESLATINDVLNNLFIYESVKSLDGSVQRQKDNEDEDASEISEEISRYLTSFFEYELNEALADFIVNKDISKLIAVIDALLEPSNVELRFKSYFKTLSITDMHSDVASLNRNKKLKEELELYLYFGQVKASNRTYPLFFVPITITEQSTENRTSYKLSFEKRFYINKNAVEYVFQEDAESNTAAQISNQIGDRIVYIDEGQTLASELNKKTGDLLSNFGIDGDVDFSSPINKSGSSSSVTINNKLALALFDKADESSINDYEELINILDEDNPLADKFKNLISGFLEQEPTSIIQEIQTNWDETPTEDKLVFSSPIPLNEEQRKIISAVNSKNGRFITVQGPPGTGKSHTITAILFEAILKGKSVLMLSDKKEALDVVEDKLSEVLDKTRMGEGFQNPILRLGREGNTYNKILANQNVENIRTHLRASEEALKVNNPKQAKDELASKTKDYINKYSEIDITSIRDYLEQKELNSISDDNENLLIEHLDKLKKYKTSVENLISFKTDENIVSYINNCNIKTTKELHLHLKTLSITEPLIQKNGDFTYLNSLGTDKSFFKEKINQYGEVTGRFFSFLLGRFQLDTWNADINKELDLKEYTDFRDDINYKKFNDIYNLTIKIEKSLAKHENAPKTLSKSVFKQIIEKSSGIDIKVIKSFIQTIDDLIEAHNDGWLEKPQFGLDAIIDKNILEADLAQAHSKACNLHNFAKLTTDLNQKFNDIPDLNIAEEVKVVQGNSSVEMVNIFDKRFLDFCDNNRTKAQTLKKLRSTTITSVVIPAITFMRRCLRIPIEL
jgi:hypothetical protein